MIIDIAASIVGVVLATLACIFSYKCYVRANNTSRRVLNCLNNLVAAKIYVEGCEISNSVMQLATDKIKFDADINEFELICSMMFLENKFALYSKEVMQRARRVPPPPAANQSSAKDDKKKEEGSKSNKSSKSKKAKSGKAAKKEEPEKKEEEKKEEPAPGPKKDCFAKPVNIDANVAAKDPNYQTLAGMNGADIFGENKKKEKFHAPEKVNKADAKDPQYETLAGIGNDLFKDEGGGGGEKKDEKKDKNDKEKDKPVQKKEFKEPEKVKKADAKDPQYETLNEVKDDIFKQ